MYEGQNGADFHGCLHGMMARGCLALKRMLNSLKSGCGIFECILHRFITYHFNYD